MGRVKGQEVSLWEFEIDPRHYYHVVPHTMRRGQEGESIGWVGRREGAGEGIEIMKRNCSG